MNPNNHWSNLFVNELATSGLTAVCIAPGSRSTPLTLAFHQHPDIEVYLHLDERCAAFFALGMAMATQKPVALVCTSGTAAAEFYGAIIEARQANIPLLILTADRPPELRHSGANQTVDQVKMYGDQVLWSVDVALPEAAAPAVALRNIQTLACRAYATALGLMNSAATGPVHLNFPFRKPLEPNIDDYLQEKQSLHRPKTHFAHAMLQPFTAQISTIAQTIGQHERGLIICGPRCPGGDFLQSIAQLAQQSGYPLLADPLSGLRFGPHVADTPIIGGYEGMLASAESFDVLLRFGALPTSKTINDYINRSMAEKSQSSHYIHVSENGIWADDSHWITEFIHADPTLLCQQVTQSVVKRDSFAWLRNFMKAENWYWKEIEQHLENIFFDGTAVAMVAEAVPPQTNLFISNSLPIRHMDQFVRPSTTPLQTFASRGASGIDGVTSTALGVAASSADPLVLIIGDVAFYHDLNGLLAIRQHGLNNVTIVLLNNNGGNIFRRLPIAEFEPAFTELFLTPHGLDFEPAAQMYGLAYTKAADRDSFQAALNHSIQDASPWIIEVSTDGIQDDVLRKL